MNHSMIWEKTWTESNCIHIHYVYMMVLNSICKYIAFYQTHTIYLNLHEFHVPAMYYSPFLMMILRCVSSRPWSLDAQLKGYLHSRILHRWIQTSFLWTKFVSGNMVPLVTSMYSSFTLPLTDWILNKFLQYQMFLVL